ncbi:GNAT family N-acetyltransferase [Marinomonas ostreistagni]|uniref:N-acetyltransferase n=1 Tax=Marinomonas ostreistagni TaxID=359209 RepID=A0ABS0ZDF9_9GAMM|nr:N-acetyltransferase [Marinomonas ostreistagni]MBJ7551709.1 N-acetyltransferase [Marinomonas ostreistagni]
MIYRAFYASQQTEVVGLFSSVFAASEGEKEGVMLAHLTEQLSSLLDDESVLGFAAYEDETLIGAIFFSRLQFETPVTVYMLSPVAVATEQQGKGIGQALIQFGLKALKARSVEVVITYGDPAYYSKVGFEPLSETVIQAPVKLSMPFGWLGQSLDGQPIPVMADRPSCVEPFKDPVYW